VLSVHKAKALINKDETSNHETKQRSIEPSTTRSACEIAAQRVKLQDQRVSLVSPYFKD
jgi:hypothetical protein